MSKICSVWTAGDFNAKKCIGYSFSQGIQKLGYSIDQHFPALLNPFSPPFCHLVISNGFRNPARDASEYLLSKGVNTFVYDLGYINRSDTKNKEGYYQLGLNRIGWTPDFKCPPDRFEKLGVRIPEVKDNGSDTVLVCAQKFNDGQHGMSAGQMKQYMADLCKKVRLMGYNVIFRSHPKSPFELEGFKSSTGTLKEDMDRSRFVVTYNSTAGVEALLNGTPAVPMAEDAHYRCVSTPGVGPEEPLQLPTKEALEDYFHRLAYSQWKLTEYADGYPYEFLLAVAEGKNPFEEYPDRDWTKLQPLEGNNVADTSDCEPVDVSHLKWAEARAAVKEITGEWPKSKAHLDEIVERYNAQV